MIVLVVYGSGILLNTSLTLKEIVVSDGDPDDSDDGAIDDLVKGRKHAKWRHAR